MAVDADDSTLGIEPESAETSPAKLGRLIGWGPKLGIWAWSFVGVVVAVTIVLFAVGAVSEIVLPLTFAAVLAVCFSPMAGGLVRRGLKPTAAAGLVVLALLAIGVFVGYSTVHGITQQTAEISSSVDAAIANAVDELDADEESLETAREAIEDAAPTVGEGFVTHLTLIFQPGRCECEFWPLRAFLPVGWAREGAGVWLGSAALCPWRASWVAEQG